MTKGNVFLPGGSYFGYDGDRFIFSDWTDVWLAVTTEGHALAKYATHVLSRRPYMKLGRFGRVSVSFDAIPPVVEVVYPRWLGFGIALVFDLVFGVIVLSLLFVR